MGRGKEGGWNARTIRKTSVPLQKYHRSSGGGSVPLQNHYRSSCNHFVGLQNHYRRAGSHFVPLQNHCRSSGDTSVELQRLYRPDFSIFDLLLTHTNQQKVAINTNTPYQRA
ncbi:hypothetical protein [Parabacteroides chinchillae]